MKRSMVLILVMLFMLFLFSGCKIQQTAASFQNESYTIRMDAEGKKAFAQEKDSQFAAMSPQELSLEEQVKLLEQLVFADEDYAEAAEALAEYGIYRYETEPCDMPAVECEDAVLMAPCLLYSPADQTWILCFGGSWVNDNWKDMDSGENDEYGVRYPDSIYVPLVDAYFQIADENNQNIVITRNRSSTSSSCNTDGFQLEDNVSGIFNKTYVGYRWFGYCVYDASFAENDAAVTGYYIHNYTK